MPEILIELAGPALVSAAIGVVWWALHTQLTATRDTVETHRQETREDHRRNGETLDKLGDEIHEVMRWQAVHETEHDIKGL